MTDINDKVWYACYGSNLLKDRFYCYIQGGQPDGANTVYEGCTDKSLPTDEEDFYINAELYFARKSSNWEKGGVAFIGTDFKDSLSTIGRIYLITKEQLVDIAKQETKTSGELYLDFDSAIRKGSYIFKQKSWYGNLLYLGDHSGFPIFTITNELSIQNSNTPSPSYLRTIIKGIKEIQNLENVDIFEYLSAKKGITGFYDHDELKKIIEDC